jgi:proline iminopeptidase
MKVLMLKDLSKNKFDLLQKLKNVETPIFAICGKQDPFLYNTYELKIAKPTTNMYLIQSCGHYPMFEQKSEFYNRLELIMHEIENFR